MTDSTPTTTDAQINHNDGAPSQLIPPDTDAGMRIRGMRADQLAYLLPGGTFVVVGAFTASFGLTTLGALLVGVGVLLLALGVFLILTTSEHTSALDRLRGRLSMTLRSHSLPLDRAGAAGIHGVERILDDGSVEMADGRIVTFARLPGRNTDFQTSEEAQSMTNSLRRGIDSSVTDIDFSIYSMAVSPDDTDITGKYKDVWLSERYDRENSRDVIGYLKSIIDGEPQNSDGWNATEWEDYIAVQVAPDDIDTPEIETVGDDAVRRQQGIEAESRLTTLRKAFSSVAGVEPQPITGPEHARVIARHWAGTRHPDEFEGLTDESVSVAGLDADTIDAQTQDGPGQRSAADDLPPLDPSIWDRAAARLGGVRGMIGSADSSTAPERWGNERIKEILAASRWDERPDDDMVVAGDQYCRTYWIGDWPTRPTAKCLKELHTMRGIDMSVHHRFEARETEAAKDELQHATDAIDASIGERKDDENPLDAGVLEDEMDAFVQFFKLIHHKDVQAWDMASYVTVRAGDRTAIAHAEQLIKRGYAESDVSLQLAKRKALEDACEEVEETLESAGLTPVTDANRQSELFRSAAPTGTDAYAEQSVTRSRKRLAPTGAIAATFPNASTTVNHEMGVELGRNPTNGRVISIDPFEHPPAHRLTLGVSGSGKTWSTLKQAVRWYLSAPDDRTLVFIDNKGDFAGATGLLNGNRITIGGRTTINPMQMKPLDQESVEASGLDPFWSKHRFVVGLILDLICETDDARDRFRSLVRDGVEKAMLDAGLDPDDPSTHTPANSPTLVDVRDAVDEIADEPSEHVQYERVGKEIDEHAGALLHKLGGFAEDGEFRFLTGESDAIVEPGEVTYLDLQQIEGVGEMDHRTTMLSVALGEVYEAVKSAPENTMFVIDEAHHLLKSQRILSWLEEQSRHWRHNDAGLWFISQHPEDFKVAEDADEAQHKSVIRDQCSITEIFPTSDKEALADFDLNEEQIHFLSEEASKADKDAVTHSDCLIDHPEVKGWLRAWITVSSGEHSIFSYDADDHGSYRDYIDEHWTRNKALTTDGGER